MFIFTKVRNYVNVIKTALAIDGWPTMQKLTLTFILYSN